jgi:hypothetical protein
MAVATATAPPSPAADARPIIPRNKTNLWTQAESVRDELYGHIWQSCTRAGVEPLLLKSPPNAFPAWLKFEAWQRQDDPSTTRRSSATITIDPKPYHRHPFEVEVTYSAGNKDRTYKRVALLSVQDVEQLIEHLLHKAPKPRLTRYREAPFQFWREPNKLEGLGKDILATVVGGCVVGGFLLLGLLPIALALWGLAIYLGIRIAKRNPIVRNEGKPDTEPRALVRVDSWQAVLFGVGDDVAMVRDRFLRMLNAGLGEHCRFHSERVWYWGLDGKEEREQLVLTSRRGIVFCQIYRYGNDLYVGWDGHLNRGQWVEQTVASGIDKGTRNPITICRVVPGTQPTNEYDLADLSCLMEWTHAQIVQLLKQLIAEKKIDQEIDFKIQRAERQQVVASGAAAAGDGGIAGKVRKAFQRTA